MDNRQRWERVLAAIEAEARRAEALLAAGPDEPVAEEAVPDAVAVPADWLLPAPKQVPADLRDRIVELQARIAVLQGDLVKALREWTPRSSLPTIDARTRTPVFIDTAL